MKSPPYLGVGDTIKIISTARKITEDEVIPAVKILESWGLNVEFGQYLFSSHHQFAGSDEERTRDFQEALNSEDVKAIFFARGGYGTTRIIDQIDFTQFIKKPKWLVGYSDITVIHNYVNSQLNIETLHASMPINYSGNTKEAIVSIKSSLFGESQKLKIPLSENYRTGEVFGELAGGNLSIIYSLRGTPFDAQLKDKILFIEDLDEYLYHLDRMMQNLKHSGVLENLSGLVVGQFTDMRDNKVPYGKKAPQIIWEAVAQYSYPVIFDFPAGHIDDNRAMILGRKVFLQVNDQGASLSF